MLDLSINYNDLLTDFNLDSEIGVNSYDIVDYTKSLKTNVNFDKNKDIPLHRWYPFVEGFSEEFIKAVLAEFDRKDIRCLEPFAGSGTTPLTLQKQSIPCYSFEVSPFMFLLTKVKLRRDYSVRGYNSTIELMKKEIEVSLNSENSIEHPPEMSSIVENSKREKWIFNKEVMDGILDIKYAIGKISNPKYRDLFRIALASILLELSNVYRNGKCLSYKKNWQSNQISREQVHKVFFDRLQKTFEPDIRLIGRDEKNKKNVINNHKLCFRGDVRKKIENLSDNSINLVITSPPYLNSRDYTDAYMVELWMLDLVKNYSNVRELRKSTIRSHVQVKWGKEDILDIDILKSAYNEIKQHEDKFWNASIPEMISGYFNDMNTLFTKLSPKMDKHGKVYFNVANSAYFGVHIPTDEIIAQIAERKKFKVEEIKVARYLPPSSQQKDLIGSLRESVIVMTKL